MTVSLVLDKWLDSREPQLFPATTDRYRVAIKHIDPAIGSMKVARLRPHHIEDFYAALYAQGQSGSSMKGGPLGVASVTCPGHIDAATRR